MLQTHALHIGYPGGPLLQCPDHVWGAGLHLVQGDEGVGKTALLCTLAGDIPVRAGYIDVGYAQGREHSPSDVFWQHPRTMLNDAELALTARAWAKRCAARYPQWSKDNFAAHAHGLGVEEHLHKPLLALSTGSLRKLWMACAWASGAPLTLIDEPLAALDEPSQRYVQQALHTCFTAQAQGMGHASTHRCVIVTHWDAMQGVEWDSILTLAGA